MTLAMDTMWKFHESLGRCIFDSMDFNGPNLTASAVFLFMYVYVHPYANAIWDDYVNSQKLGMS